MKKVIVIICSLFIFAALFGCASEAQQHENNFEVGIDTLSDIQANETFEIIGFLKNSSKHTVKISHGSDIFTYEIFDAEGTLIPPQNHILARNDIGYLRELQPDEVYRNNGKGQRSKEYYEYVIAKPGRYTVKTKVEFRLENEGNKAEQIVSEPYTFIVN
ncbi:hypothetical protein [Paenibacillus sp. MMS18-CY102]|uniref:hypothetical protein n=1 Tax=Paenibacillus sp. MMS18-CY102 TaxID=2682849 RepID=UPI001365892F|nr:hypothetical protein [Paenibacillus sp. MMS18-CY102]MWC30939.1 hypothetical protein [Paenibacillus sp. MMS18-CY102]